MAVVKSIAQIDVRADMSKAQSDAVKLKDTLKQAKSVADNIGGGASLKAAYRASSKSNELDEYGKMRSIRPETTGASARDFAQQAQGLGGLVRLYATYAANIFAVTAAFQALSAAQDTANMVKGLDQLGAASGTALGRLSKDFVKATDGAISLREGMEAVVKASSSGMNSKDIMRMGEVAKKASQALGVNMADAVSRISRGITKLEPELLDELGIFARIDPAVKAYAKSVNKTTEELTQFERQMAFSNAVLSEGEQKFREIQIDSNPYSKLAASLRDTSTELGNMLNTVLSPIAEFLAKSPTALYAALGLLTTRLLKQAVPALGEFREASRQAAEAANISAARKVAGTYSVEQINNLKKLREAEEEISNQKLENLERIEAKTAALGKKVTSKEFSSIVENKISFTDFSDADLQRLDKIVESKKRYSQITRDNAQAVADWVRSERHGIMLQEEVARMQAQTPKGITPWLNNKIATNATRDAVAHDIAATAAQTASTEGLKKAFSDLGATWQQLRTTGITKTFEELDAAGVATGRTLASTTGRVGILRASMMTLPAAFSAVGSAATTLMSALSGILGGIGILVASYGLISMFFSKSEKEVQKFNDSLDSAKDYVLNLQSVLERGFKTTAQDLFSSKSLEAYSNSLLNVSQGLEKITDDAEAAKKAVASSTFDTLINGFKGLWGGDVATKEKEAFSSALSSVVTSIQKIPGNAKPAQLALERLLGVSNVKDAKELEKALDKISGDPVAKQQAIKLINQLHVEFGTAASRSKEFQDSMQKSTDAFKAFQNSFVDKTPLVQYAQESQTAISKLQLALESNDILENIDNIAKFGEQLKANPLFGAEAAVAVISYSEKVVALSEKLKEARTKAEELNKSQSTRYIEEEVAKETTGAAKAKKRAQLAQARMTLEDPEIRRALNRSIASIQQEIGETSDKIGDALSEGSQRAAGFISSTIESALAKGSTLFKQNLLSTVIGPNQAAVREGTSLKNYELDIESRMLKAQQDLLVEAKRTNVLLALRDAKDDLSKEESKPQAERNAVAIARAKDRVSTYTRINDQLSGSVNARGLTSLARDIRTLNSADANAAADSLNNLGLSMAGLEAKQNQLSQQKRVNVLQGELRIEDEKFKKLEEKYAIDLSTNKTLADRVTLEKELGMLDPLDAEKRIKDLEYSRESIQLEQEKSTILRDQEKLAIQKKFGLKGQAVLEAEEHLKNRARLQEERKLQLDLNKSRTDSELIRKQISANLELASARQAVEKTYTDIDNTKVANRIALEEQLLSTLEKAGTFEFDNDELSRLKAKIEVSKIELDTEKRKSEMQTERNSAYSKFANIMNSEQSAAQKAIAKEQLLADLTRLDNELGFIDQIRIARLDTIEAEEKARKLAMQNEIADTFAESIASALFDGGKSGLDKLKDYIRDAFRDSITDALKQSMRGGFANALQGSSNSNTIAGGAGAPGTLSSLTSIGNVLFNGLSKGVNTSVNLSDSLFELSGKLGENVFTSTIDGFATGLGATSSMMGAEAAIRAGGVQLAGFAVGSLLNGFSGYGISKALSGGYEANSSVNKIAAIASMVPGVGPIAGLIGAAVNRAFGRKLVGSGISGTFGGDTSGFEGKNYKDYKGGWFRSDKTKYSDMDTELQKSLQQQYLNLRQSTLMKAGQVVGLPNTQGISALSEYKKDIKLNFSGKSESEVSEMIQNEFDSMGDEMAKAFLTTTTSTVEKVKRTITEQSGYWDDLVTTSREIEEEVTTSTTVLREDLPRWMQDIVDLKGPTAEALELLVEFPKTMLTQFGTSRDALVDTFAEGLLTGRAAEAGTLVANTIVQSIEKSLVTSAAGQIFDIINQTIVTPILYNLAAGQSAAEVLTEAAINDTISRVEAVAAAFGTLMQDTKFKETMDRLKSTLAGAFGAGSSALGYTPQYQNLATTFAETGTAAESAGTAIDELKEKLKELAKTSIESLFDSLTSALKKNADGIKSSIEKVKDFTKSMLDFKTKLLLGDNSTLTPAEKYIKAKTEFETTYSKAIAGDQSAIDKLQSASDNFLQQSRLYYASGSEYTRDFNTVLEAIDTSIGAAESLEGRLNEALITANGHLAMLGGIEDTLTNIEAILEVGLSKTSDHLLAYLQNTGSTSIDAQGLVSAGLATVTQAAQLIQALDKDLNGRIETSELIHARNIGANTQITNQAINTPSPLAVSNASVAGIATYGANSVASVGGTNVAYSSAGAIGYQNADSSWNVLLNSGISMSADTLRNLIMTEGPKFIEAGMHRELADIAKRAGLSSVSLSGLTGVPYTDVLSWMSNNNIPAFDKGINYVPEDMFAQIHKGERIMPEADNRDLMDALRTDRNMALINEIKQLNTKLDKLEEAVRKGAVINALATEKNTEAVVDAVVSTTDRSILASKIKDKVQLK